MERLREPEDDEDTPARSKFLSRSAQPLFEYSPLDLDAPSIRQVRVLADLSSDGHIRLEICHASTKSTYSCLSYVWGRERTLHWIRLGERLFQVRHNLRAFLQSARKKPHVCSEWLWIDALCIDQSNNSERSHQVQQMGHIFSRAVKVISWLGDDEVIAQFFRESTPPLMLHAVYSKQTHPGWVRFLQSDYWARAWITQEVALARLITFMAGNEEIDRLQPPEWEENDVVLFQTLDAVYFVNYSHLWRDRSLIYLLQMFSRKDCRNRCDRIFSLLGMCGQGSDLDVDYDISYEDLSKRVLQVCSNSFCLCAVRLLDRVLNLEKPEAEVVEKQLFATLSLYTPNEFIDSGGPLAVRIRMPALCPLFSGTINVEIARGHCYGKQNLHDTSILYYDACDISINGEVPREATEDEFTEISRKREFKSKSWGHSVSYDRDAKIWNITFPFATLVQLARMEAAGDLCTRGNGADAASAKAHDEPKLHMSLGSDPYIDAPDLSLPARRTSNLGLHRRLRSFEVRPYLDYDGQSRYCGVFVYDWEHDIGFDWELDAWMYEECVI
ncbi:hypothetical protein AA0117_g8143 [Alternaria alternata]|jgi:hypothetical protein|uniref:Heterokaryon incompatibility domain-containing protein n=1 Tax=Alternaria alternata TaxID=5599 RepID=A0A4Q4NCB1_ALTAL|nr:hypothetical protein AA0117_g8143 [Alternaria alternata]